MFFKVMAEVNLTTYLHMQRRRSRRARPPSQRAELRRGDEDDEKALELVAHAPALQPQTAASSGALGGRESACWQAESLQQRPPAGKSATKVCCSFYNLLVQSGRFPVRPAVT